MVTSLAQIPGAAAGWKKKGLVPRNLKPTNLQKIEQQSPVFYFAN